MILWTVAHQFPLCMRLSRQECWGGLPFPSPGDLSDPGIEPVSLMSPVLVGRFFIISTTWEAEGTSKLITPGKVAAGVIDL